MDGDTKGLQRPGLAGVIEALTNTSPGHYMLWSGMGAWSISGKGSRYDKDVPGRLGVAVSNPWTVTDPRDAMELLQTRGLAPEDDVRRGFWCSRCAGSGVVTVGPFDAPERGNCSVEDADVTGGLRRVGHLPEPDTIPELVAYTSLSVPAILRAEELARETVARLRPWGCPQPERVVWRAGDRGPCDHAMWRGAGYNGNVAISRRGVLFVHADDGMSGPVPPACDLWDMGLALDSITADAVTICVAPVGGAR